VTDEHAAPAPSAGGRAPEPKTHGRDGRARGAHARDGGTRRARGRAPAPGTHGPASGTRGRAPDVSGLTGTVLVDSCVLLDVLTDDPEWADWSADMLEQVADRAVLAVNPVIYAEVSIGFDRIEDLEDALPQQWVTRLPVPWEAAFLAGKSFLRYRRAGGSRTTPLPDFFIGAHAAVESLPLLTRDARRYATYFPTVRLIAP